MRVGDRVIIVGDHGAASSRNVGKAGVIVIHDPADNHCEFYVNLDSEDTDWVSRCDIRIESEPAKFIEQRVADLEAKLAKLEPLLAMLK